MPTRTKRVTGVIRAGSFDDWYDLTKDAAPIRGRVPSCRKAEGSEANGKDYILFLGNDLNTKEPHQIALAVLSNVVIYAIVDEAFARGDKALESLPVIEHAKFNY